MARRDLRLRPSRPGYAIAGVVLMALSGIALFALFGRAGERHDVLALSRPVAAGAQLVVEDVRVVAIGSDDDLAATPAGRLDEMIGRYARFDLAEGALLTPDSVQARPLVSAGRVLMSITLRPGRVPDTIAADDHVVIVATVDGECATIHTVDATMVAITGDPGGTGAQAAPVALTVEVPPEGFAVLAGAEPESLAIVQQGAVPQPVDEACAENADTPEPSTGAGAAGSLDESGVLVPAPPTSSP